MVTIAQVVNWAKGMADKGTGYDADGAYGQQCVDLTNGASKIFFGKTLWGNGVDMLNAARSAGYRIETSGLPRPGAFFAANVSGHQYGHTGLVVGHPNASGAFQTVEQNVDGGIYNGGPARYRTRTLNGGGMQIFGWFYPPYEDLDKPVESKPQQANPSNPEKSGGDKHMAINFIFNITNHSDWDSSQKYFYNGAINEIQLIHNSEEEKYLNSIFKETNNNNPLKGYTWDDRSAPVHIRIFGVLQPTTRVPGLQAKISDMIRRSAAG